ncbi:MAG TPA: type 1 glutamine amidotransferase [Methylomirabilota bacterium]|nr:type 1 glutamine amidotransferase [Methylomirabilota bacterium]
MRILVVDNYPQTSLGLIGRALDEAGATVDLRIMHQGGALPDGPGAHDAMVLLGGGQNALADAEHPYLPHLAALTRAFGEADKAVLGVCLGSQLVARGHGAANIIGRPIEFGWKTVRPTAAAASDPVLSALGDGAPLFHWHYDTFTLPPGAAHLAASDQTPHQAFRIGRAVYGVQFHFEADRTLVEAWTSGFADVIAGHTPDWPARHSVDAETHGPAADAVGLAIARAWVAQVRV